MKKHRFGKTPKEKALRKAKFEVEKRKQKLIKAKKVALQKNKPKDLVDSTKRVAENPDQLSFAENIEQAIKPVDKYLKTDVSNISLTQIAGFGQAQAQDLTERINLLEIEIEGLEESLNQLNLAANGWRTERTMLKELIRIDQDNIFEDEFKLDILDAKGQESPPGRPEILRHIISRITNQPDEVLVNMNLSRLEVQLLGRVNLLAKVDIELGSILITLRYQENLLNNIYSSNEFLRSIRCEIGEFNRTLRRSSKKQGIDSERKIYFTEFLNQINKINQIQEDLENKMLKVNQGLNIQFIEFEQMQNESLKSVDKTSDAYKATKALDQLIFNLSKDKK